MTDDDKTIEELLQEAPFLQALSPDDLAKVAEIASRQEFEPQSVLFQEGSPIDRLYLVARGRIALEMCMPRRGCVRIQTVGPREIVGLSALLSIHNSMARAVVVEPSTLIAFPTEQLHALCEADHDIGYVLMTRIAEATASRLLATRLQALDIFGETEPAEPPTS